MVCVVRTSAIHTYRGDLDATWIPRARARQKRCGRCGESSTHGAIQCWRQSPSGQDSFRDGHPQTECRQIYEACLREVFTACLHHRKRPQPEHCQWFFHVHFVLWEWGPPAWPSGGRFRQSCCTIKAPSVISAKAPSLFFSICLPAKPITLSITPKLRLTEVTTTCCRRQADKNIFPDK